MNSQQDKVAQLFEAAVEIETPSERAAFLDAFCNGDQQFRAEIEELLRHDDAAGNFLDNPCLAESDTSLKKPSIKEQPGTIIGSYKLLEQIGEGGFGVVFMAEQTQPVRRKVALKVLKPGMDTSQVVARFEAERQTLALMNHPNIAKVFDAGETPSGRPYFVMELVRGITVTDYCDQNQLPVRERLELFVSICQAVQHAHQKGIIHRDLKPSNILVTLYDGKPVVKVIDFGISKALGQQLTDKTLFTNFTQMMGTPIYMSPEQAEMSGLDIDTRSDIYSLGVLLYELLSGTTPRDKDRLRTAAYDEIRRIIREEEPARLSARISTLGHAARTVSANRQSDPTRLSQLFRGELDWIVMKALEKDRNRRYDTAVAFATDVQRYLNDEAVLACPPSPLYRFGKFARRNKTALSIGAVITVAVLLTLFTLARSNYLVTRESAQKELALQDKSAAMAAATASAREATDQLFLALLNQARTGRFSRHMGQRLDSLAALEKAAHIRPDDQLRDEAMAALALPDIRRGLSIHAFPAGSKGITFDGLYQSYARINDSGSISVHRIPDNENIQTIKMPRKAITIQISPDGKILVAVDDNLSVQLFHIADGQPLLRQPSRPCVQGAFSPNSQQWALALEDWIHIFDLSSGLETNRWRVPAKIYALAFHPDNRTLAVGFANSLVASLYDSSRGSLIADLPIGAISNPVFAWHPDGANLAVSGSDPRIHIWDVARQRKLATLEGHVGPVTVLSYHPNGSMLASNSFDCVLRLWDTATGRQHMQLPMSAITQFSNNGYLGYMWQGDEYVQLLELSTSREYRTIGNTFGAGKGPYHDGSISPNGRFLALGMGNAGDRVWDLASGQELAQLPSGGHCVQFQSDGQTLFTLGDGGLLRWPIEYSQQSEIRLGPPHKIALPIVSHRASGNPGSKLLAVISEVDGAGLLLDIATASVQGQVFSHPLGSQIVLSPDGQWIASCGWHSDRVRLWNAKTGIMVHEWGLGPMNSVFFTPDSQSLIYCRGDAFTFWDIKTLQPIRRLARDVALYPGHVAFSSDGKLMALEMAPGVIHLKEVATGRTITKLEDPHGDRAGWMSFTPDGTQLVVVAPYAKAIHVWELRLMRQKLKEIGLDWDWPDFPPPGPTVQMVRQPKMEVLSGELDKSQTMQEQHARRAIDRRRRNVTANPDNPVACNDLAWIYLTAPAALRDVEAALPLAEHAVKLDARNADYRNTLGVAYYRAGRFREAVEMLRPNLDKQDDQGLALDLYFLAMSHHRLGETDRARDYFAWALRWTQAQTELSARLQEELKAFRAEAEALLGIQKEP